MVLKRQQKAERPYEALDMGLMCMDYVAMVFPISGRKDLSSTNDLSREPEL